ncbi:poly-gamma-glutamate synthase PgsB [bacterium]|nr:poly-gamma-glutamate synthase PgsB [bacterium]
MLIPVVLLAVVVGLLIGESLVIRRRVRSLDIRIHVNGTRGKSSVTRYIAAALRADGRRTWAKVTGVRPTIILPDGSSCRIKRHGAARVQEQFSIIRRAAVDRADCLVLECMSIQPELQALEGKHFKAHIYVLTNVHDDHREALGDDIRDHIHALCAAAPRDSIIVTVSGDHLPELERVAAARGNRIIVAESPAVSVCERLPDGVFASNVALALAVGRLYHISEERVLAAILEAETRVGPTASPIGEAAFVDGFAVNDVPSAKSFIAHWRKQYGSRTRLTVVFNARADRPLRSVSFATYLPGIDGLDRVILIGSHAPFMHRALRGAGMPAHRITRWNAGQAADARRELEVCGVGADHLVIGLGNIAGDGFIVAEALQPEVRRAV